MTGMPQHEVLLQSEITRRRYTSDGTQLLHVPQDRSSNQGLSDRQQQRPQGPKPPRLFREPR